jgi:hypothetical protein
MMNGGTLHDLQVILGHAGQAMVLRYAHLAPGYIVRQSSAPSLSPPPSSPSVVAALTP